MVSVRVRLWHELLSSGGRDPSSCGHIHVALSFRYVEIHSQPIQAFPLGLGLGLGLVHLLVMLVFILSAIQALPFFRFFFDLLHLLDGSVVLFDDIL